MQGASSLPQRWVRDWRPLARKQLLDLLVAAFPKTPRFVASKSDLTILLEGAIEIKCPKTGSLFFFLATASPFAPRTGALVKELELSDGRLHYALLSGQGPAQGWVSTQARQENTGVCS